MKLSENCKCFLFWRKEKTLVVVIIPPLYEGWLINHGPRAIEFLCKKSGHVFCAKMFWGKFPSPPQTKIWLLWQFPFPLRYDDIAIWNKQALVNFSKTTIFRRFWKIYLSLFIANCISNANAYGALRTYWFKFWSSIQRKSPFMVEINRDIYESGRRSSWAKIVRRQCEHLV